MKKILLLSLISVVILMFGSMAMAQLPAFPGSKVLDSGPNPVGIGNSSPTSYQYTIHLNSGFNNTLDVVDVVPAEFDVVSVTPSCGSAISVELKKPGDKLRPDVITWDLNGGTPCDNSSSQSLIVSISTDQNPGKGLKNRGIIYEPTSCGPLYLNDGAVMIDPSTGEPVTEPSNSLFVAACVNEIPADCVDGDNDGWSKDCGDCNDGDASIYPGAPEICGDGIDQDCSGADLACL